MDLGCRRDSRGAIRALLLTALALLLAACSSPHALPTTTSSPTRNSTSTSVPSTTTTLVAAAACSTGVLQLSTSTGGAAAGSTYDIFTVTNGGPSGCELNGYPSVIFFGPSAGGGAGAGPRLALGVEDGGPSPAPVILPPNGSAEFLLFFSDVPVGGAGCSTVASVEVEPPGSAESISAPASFTPCGPTVRVYAFGAKGTENP